jgi:APA family basic amino acid/polyamine antiporter
VDDVDPDEGKGGIINLPAILVCLLVTWILSRGTKTFGRFELIAVAIKVVLILFIIGLGVFYINTQNFNPFMPSGFGPVLAGSATVFFAVFGYDAMSTAAEEATDGKKHMPKAIILSLIIAMLLYVAATLVLTGMQNYKDIDPAAGFASAFQGVGLPVIATIISVFAVLSILTVMLTFLLGVTRVWFSMSRDGLLPGWFSKTDRHGTPQRVTWIGGVASALLAGVFPIKAVADLTNIGILAAFVVVCISVIIFRYTKPEAPADLPPAADAGGPRIWRPGLRLPDVPAALGDLAALRHLARDRPGDLLRLRQAALADEPEQPAAQRGRGDAHAGVDH